MKQAKQWITAGIIGLVMAMVAAAPASAVSSPDVGYACVWVGHSGWKSGAKASCGSGKPTPDNTEYYGSFTIKTNDSAWANGKSCFYTRFGISTVIPEDVTTKGTFTLYSQYKAGYNYRDPDLTNGAGFDSTESFTDRVRSFRFNGCR
jgi:hypothetical protein